MALCTGVHYRHRRTRSRKDTLRRNARICSNGRSRLGETSRLPGRATVSVFYQLVTLPLGVRVLTNRYFRVCSARMLIQFLICTPVITDPEDPNFDLEKLLVRWEKDHS